MFIVTSIIHFVGIIFYGIFASALKQPWAEPQIQNNDNDIDENEISLKVPKSYEKQNETNNNDKEENINTNENNKNTTSNQKLFQIIITKLKGKN